MFESKRDFEAWIESFVVNESTYPPVITDLFSLYKFVKKNKITSILEIGSGWSTLVLVTALRENYDLFGKEYLEANRNPNPFRLVTLDASEKFMSIALNRVPRNELELITPIISTPIITTINNQICHIFENLPLFSPDLVYLDGPDCEQVNGSINNFSNNPNHPSSISKFGVPMSGDLLLIENFLQPGTQITVDGRGANANFLRTNFRKSWRYKYDEHLDQHFFKELGKPWGRWSKVHLSR